MSWAPDYCTPEFLKSYLDITDNADDVLIGLWVTTASRNVDDFCGRQFGSVPAETREYPTIWDRHLGLYVADIDDLFDDADSVIGADASVISDYTLGPVNAVKAGRPYTQLATSVAGPLTVEAAWGWPAVPAAVSVGLLLQAARLNARRRSPFGVAGSPSQGSEIRLLAQLDPDFRTSLRPLVRGWWAR